MDRWKVFMLGVDWKDGAGFDLPDGLVIMVEALNEHDAMAIALHAAVDHFGFEIDKTDQISATKIYDC